MNIKKTPRWQRTIAVYLQLIQSNGLDRMLDYIKEVESGSVDYEAWSDAMAHTWFIIRDNHIVGQSTSQWGCLATKIEGDFVPARILIQDILAGRSDLMY